MRVIVHSQPRGLLSLQRDFIQQLSVNTFHKSFFRISLSPFSISSIEDSPRGYQLGVKGAWYSSLSMNHCCLFIIYILTMRQNLNHEPQATIHHKIFFTFHLWFSTFLTIFQIVSEGKYFASLISLQVSVRPRMRYPFFLCAYRSSC